MYLAKHLTSGELSVVKIIKTEKMSPKEIEASTNEAKLLKKCSSNYIVQFKEVYEERKTISIVMEYADGTPY